MKFWNTGEIFINPETMNNMFNWSQFVLRQPKEFQIAYFDCYLEDTYTSYDGDDDEDNISCPKGIYERQLIAIGDACIMYCTKYEKKQKSATKRSRSSEKKNKTSSIRSSYSNCEKSKYIKLIKLFKKEIPDLNDLTKEWSKILDCDDTKNISAENLKKHFIDFMTKTYKRFGIDKENEILKRAKDFEDMLVFENKTFGGRNRNKKKSKNRKL